MNPANAAAAGVALATVCFALFVLAVVACIGAGVLMLVCRIFGERDVSFGTALKIMITVTMINGVIRIGMAVAGALGAVPQLGSSPATLVGLSLLGLTLNLLLFAAVTSATIPTAFPKAIGIGVVQFTVLLSPFLLLGFIVGLGLSTRPPSGPGVPAVASSVPAHATFLTEALDDLKSLEGFEAGGPVASVAPPSPDIGAVPRPATGRGAAGAPSESQFMRPGQATPGTTTPRILVWKVQPDPPAEVVAIPVDKPIRIAVPQVFGGHDVLFPTVASPFVAVGKNRDFNGVREVWDLRKGQSVFRLHGQIDLDEKPLALSPDGQILAGKVFAKNVVHPWSLAAGKPFRPIDLGNAVPDVFDFAGPDRLVIGSTRAKRLEVWDFRVGRTLHQIETPSPMDRDAVAISPGFRYLAATFKDDSALRVYDLQTGQVAGEVTLPKEGPFGWTGQGMAFAPDGTELAAVMESFGKVRILCWKVADGSVAAGYTFDDQGGLKRSFGYEDRGLQWMPGLDAWLLFGESVVDRQSGQKVHTFAFDREHYPASPRRPLDAARMLILFADNRTRTVGDAEIPKDLIQKLETARAGGAASPPLPP